ncbi:unnamed protein product [Amoebophrya sp. A120]|nr:unnamed protein product [Amoebophrya sp. A120]|eukprot:GSA120T00001556001.1
MAEEDPVEKADPEADAPQTRRGSTESVDAGSVTSAAVRRVIDIILRDAVAQGEQVEEEAGNNADPKASSENASVLGADGERADVGDTATDATPKKINGLSPADIEAEFLAFWRAREAGTLGSSPQAKQPDAGSSTGKKTPVEQQQTALPMSSLQIDHPDLLGIEIAPPAVTSPSLRYGPARYPSNAPATHAAPDRYVRNPAYLSAQGFLDGLIKICKEWQQIHAPDTTTTSTASTSTKATLNSAFSAAAADRDGVSQTDLTAVQQIQQTLSRRLLQLTFASGAATASREYKVVPASVSRTMPPLPVDKDIVFPTPEFATAVVRRAIKKVDARASHAVRRALQEIFHYFARADAESTTSTSGKIQWVSVYQWHLFVQSFGLLEVTQEPADNFHEKFGPRKEPIDFLYFTELLSEVAIAFLEKVNYPLTIAQLNIGQDHADRVAALYRFCEVWGLQKDGDLDWRKFLRGRERIRLRSPTGARSPTMVVVSPTQARLQSQALSPSRVRLLSGKQPTRPAAQRSARSMLSPNARSVQSQPMFHPLMENKFVAEQDVPQATFDHSTVIKTLLQEREDAFKREASLLKDHQYYQQLLQANPPVLGASALQEAQSGAQVPTGSLSLKQQKPAITGAFEQAQSQRGSFATSKLPSLRKQSATARPAVVISPRSSAAAVTRQSRSAATASTGLGNVRPGAAAASKADLPTRSATTAGAVHPEGYSSRKSKTASAPDTALVEGEGGTTAGALAEEVEYTAEEWAAWEWEQYGAVAAAAGGQEWDATEHWDEENAEGNWEGAGAEDWNAEWGGAAETNWDENAAEYWQEGAAETAWGAEGVWGEEWAGEEAEWAEGGQAEDAAGEQEWWAEEQ